MPEPHYVSDYVRRQYGYPSKRVYDPSLGNMEGASVTSPLTSGIQMGLFGAMAGLSPTAVQAATGRKMSAGKSVRNMLIGAFIGSTLGALSGMGTKRRGPTDLFSPAQKYKQGMYTETMNKQAIGVSGTLAAIWAISKVLFAAGDAHAAYRSRQAAKEYAELGMDHAARSKNIGAAGRLGAAATWLIPGSMLARPVTWASKIPGLARGARALSKVPIAGKLLPRATEAVRPAMTALPYGAAGFGDRIDTHPYMQNEYNNRRFLKDVEEQLDAHGGVISPSVRDNMVKRIPASGTASTNNANKGIMSGFIDRFKDTPPPKPQFVPEGSEWGIAKQGQYSSTGSLGGITLGELYREIRSDPALSDFKKQRTIRQIESVTSGAPLSTPISSLMSRGLGGVVGYLISKYFGMGPLGKVVSTVAGYGLGKTVHDQFNRPPRTDPPGWRML